MRVIVGEVCGHSSLSQFVVGLCNVIVMINILRLGPACCCLSVSNEPRACADRVSGPVVAWGLRRNDGDRAFSL